MSKPTKPARRASLTVDRVRRSFLDWFTIDNIIMAIIVVLSIVWIVLLVATIDILTTNHEVMQCISEE